MYGTAMLASIAVWCFAEYLLIERASKETVEVSDFQILPSCTDKEIPYGLSELTIERAEDVVVRANLTLECESEVIGTVVEINGQFVLTATDPVIFDEKHVSSSSACLCAQQLTFRLSGSIPKPAVFLLVVRGHVWGKVRET